MRRRRAVSLVELLTVAVLIGIVALVTVPAGIGTSGTDADEAASRIQLDLSHAQSEAIVLRKPQCIVCDKTQGFYYLAAAASSSTPTVDPISDKPYKVLFSGASSGAVANGALYVQSYSSVSLSGADFDGSGTLVFNALGQPVTTAGVALASGSLQISAGSRQLTITVDPVSGATTVQEVTAQQLPQGQQPQ